MMTTCTPQQRQQLERDGYAIIRGAVPRTVCDRAIACIDRILGPPGQEEVPIAGRGQTARWPDPAGLVSMMDRV